MSECKYCSYMFTTDGKLDQVISCESCANKKKRPSYEGGNNTYYKEGCPALMNDGRFITYYNSSHELTEAMRKLNGFKSANQFRNFMQSNADLFMEADRTYQEQKNTCNVKTACSEGYYDLWSKQCGNWNVKRLNH